MLEVRCLTVLYDEVAVLLLEIVSKTGIDCHNDYFLDTDAAEHADFKRKNSVICGIRV